MMDKKLWAQKFQQALENKDSLERYPIETNWWNDFKSELMIVQEVYDFDIEQGEIALLGSDNKFDNSKLIKEGDYEERTNLINKMKELQKDSIKTLQEYFMINTQLIVNKDFSLIGGEAYDMLVQLTNGARKKKIDFEQQNEIQDDTELNDNVITGFMEGNDNLNERQFIDLETMQLGIIIKYQDKTIIEVGYYPKNKSLSHILKVVTKRMNIDYSAMAVDFRQSSTESINQSQDALKNDIKILKEASDEKFFYYNKRNTSDTQSQNKTLAQLCIPQNQIIIFTDQYSAALKSENYLLLDEADELNFSHGGGFNQQYNLSYQPFNDFQQENIVNNLVLNINILNSNNNICGRMGSNATLASTYDSPTQIHNNSLHDREIEDEDEDLDSGIHGIQIGHLKKNRNILKRRQNQDDLTEDNDIDNNNHHNNQEINNFNGNRIISQEEDHRVPKQILGFAKSQEEINQIEQEIKNSIGRSGSLQMIRLPNQIIAQNMNQMINQMTLSIQEQLYQRAKQEKNSHLGQYIAFSNKKGNNDSERTSSTSTQPENIKKKKRITNINILFDEPNVIDIEEASQLN